MDQGLGYNFEGEALMPRDHLRGLNSARLGRQDGGESPGFVNRA